MQQSILERALQQKPPTAQDVLGINPVAGAPARVAVKARPKATQKAKAKPKVKPDLRLREDGEAIVFTSPKTGITHRIAKDGTEDAQLNQIIKNDAQYAKQIQAKSPEGQLAKRDESLRKVRAAKAKGENVEGRVAFDTSGKGTRDAAEMLTQRVAGDIERTAPGAAINAIADATSAKPMLRSIGENVGGTVGGIAKGLGETTATGQVAGMITDPAHLAAEIATVLDPSEKGLVRAGAGANIFARAAMSLLGIEGMPAAIGRRIPAGLRTQAVKVLEKVGIRGAEAAKVLDHLNDPKILTRQERAHLHSRPDEWFTENYQEVKAAADQGDARGKEMLGMFEDRLRSSNRQETRDFVRTQIDGVPPTTPLEEQLRLSLRQQIDKIRERDPAAARAYEERFRELELTSNSAAARELDPEIMAVREGGSTPPGSGGGSGGSARSGGAGGFGDDPELGAMKAEIETTFGKIRAVSRSFRLMSVVNRLKDVAQNTVSATVELAFKNIDAGIDRVLFPRLTREYGAASGIVSPKMIKVALAGGRRRWAKEISEQLKAGNMAELSKYGITREAPGVLKYVGRATGVSDIPFRDFWHRVTVEELKKANPKLSLAQLETIAGEEELLQVFANENIIGDITKTLERKAQGSEAGQAALLMTDLAIPFPKILANVAGRATDYAGGSIKAGWELFVKHGMQNRTRVRNAKGSLFPNDAKAVLTISQRRSINAMMRRNMVGTGAVLLGYYLRQNKILVPEEVNKQGGYMRWGDNFENIGGAFAKALQLGATYAELTSGDYTDNQKLTMGGGAIADIWNQPAISGGAKSAELLNHGSPKRVGKELGRMAASAMIPAEVRNLAKWLDSVKDRKRETFGDEIMNAVPGLRPKLQPKDARAK